MEEDDRSTCNDCGDFLKEEEFVHTVKYGYWLSAENSMRDNGQVEHYCRDCWSERSPMKRGTKIEVESGEELVKILGSSNGKLVADFNSQIVGSRVFMRLNEGESQFAYVKARQLGDNTIGFNSEFESKSKQEAIEFAEDVICGGDLPPLVILMEKDNTPFHDYPEIEEDQSRIEEF